MICTGEKFKLMTKSPVLHEEFGSHCFSEWDRKVTLTALTDGKAVRTNK